MRSIIVVLLLSALLCAVLIPGVRLAAEEANNAPGAAWPDLEAARSLHQQQKWADAAPLLAGCLRSAKGDSRIEIKQMLVSCHRELKNWANAEKLCKELAADCPKERGRWLYTIADGLVSQRKYKEAMRALRAAKPTMAAAGIDPLQAYQAIGDGYLQSDCGAGLDAYLAKLLADEPKMWPDVAFSVAHKLHERHIDGQRSVRLLEEIATQVPPNKLSQKAKEDKVGFYFDLHEWANADRTIRALIAQYPEKEVEYLSWSIRGLEMQKRYADAVPVHEKIAAKTAAAGGDPMQAYQSIGDCYLRTDPGAGLDAYLAKLLADQPAIWPDVAFSVAHKLIEQRIDGQKSVRLLEEIATQVPPNKLSQKAKEDKVGFYFDLHEWANADSTCDALTAQYPEKEVEYLWWTTRGLEMQKRYSDAIPVYEKIAAKTTAAGGDPLQAYHSIGDCYLRTDSGAGLDAYLAKLRADQPAVWPDVAFSVAHKLLEQKIDGQKSVRLLEEIATQVPPNKLSQKAKEDKVGFYFDLQEWANADRTCEALIAQYPEKEVEYLSWSIRGLEMQKRYADAVPVYEKIAAKTAAAGGDPMQAYQSIGDCYLRTDSGAGLDEYLAQLLVDQPAIWPEVAFSVAHKLHERNIDGQKSVRLFEQIATQVPPNKLSQKAKEDKVGFYFDLHEWANADITCEALTAQYPEKEVEYLWWTTRGLEMQKRYADAIPVYEKIAAKTTAAGGDPLQAYHSIGDCYLRTDSGAGLDAYLAKLHADKPEIWPDVAFSVAHKLFNQKIDGQRGLRVFEQIATQVPPNKLSQKAKEDKVGYYQDLGEWSNSENTCKELIKLYPSKEGDYLLWMAQGLEKQKKYAEAVPVYEAAMARMAAAGADPSWIYGAIGNCYMRGDHDAGLDAFLAKLKAKRPDVWASQIFTIGAVMVEERIDMDRGIELLKRFVAEMPDHPNTNWCRMETALFYLWWMHKPVEARGVLDEMAKRPDVDMLQINYNLAHCSYLEEDWSTAYALFKSVCDAGSDSSWKPAAEYWAADCCVRLGQIGSAVDHYEALVSRYPQDPMAKDAPRRIRKLKEPKG